MKHLFQYFFLLCLLSCSITNKDISETRKYLNEVFEIIEKHSINRDSLNFQQLKKTAYSELKNTESIEDCYPIIKSILENLNDNHSFFNSKEQVEAWQSTSKTDSINELITFTGKLIKNNIGYLHMKGFSSGDSISIQNYADSLQLLIKSIDNYNLKGWILDIRENTGGNCWPMLTGIGPLLNDGICGYFIHNDQKRYSWFYRAGAAGIDSVAITQLSIEPYKLLDIKLPIAVLTGSKTGSSGEIVATAFRNKNNTKSFGENTAGLSTANTPYMLSDGSMILLTTSIYADRLGNLYGNELIPDRYIKFSYQEVGKQNDPVIKSALNWIYKKNN
ncbi:MAG: S41 family peptidase [Candidatus Cloacimonadota bacterium]|nr:S41 family peptidase [Candidatus Cloacimonadota bacterium]